MLQYFRSIFLLKVAVISLKKKKKKSQPRNCTHYSDFCLTHFVNENRCQSNALLTMQIFNSWKALEVDKEIVDNGFHWYVTKG